MLPESALLFAPPPLEEISYPPYTIITFPGNTTAPCPYTPPADAAPWSAGTSHAQSPNPTPTLTPANCGSAAWPTSPPHPPYTTSLVPSSLSTAVCPDRLSTLSTSAAVRL